MLHILEILPLIRVRIFLGPGFFPHALPVLHSLLKHTTISVAVCPSVLPVPFSPAIAVLAKVDVTVSKYVRALAMSQTMPPFALVAVAVRPLMNTVTVSFVLNPLANIAVACMSLPNAITVLQAI
jgi:hypothetical protein